jgi:hypothetical protein
MINFKIEFPKNHRSLILPKEYAARFTGSKELQQHTLGHCDVSGSARGLLGYDVV